MMPGDFLHYSSAAITIMLGSLGGGIAQGIAGSSSLNSMLRQPISNNNISKAMIIGLALIESSIIIALVTTLSILLRIEKQSNLGIGLAELGISLAVGVAALSISIASSISVKASTISISREPLFAPKIFTFMLLTQSVIEAPVIFAFVLGIVIRTNLNVFMTSTQGLKYLSAGILFALGCIGSSIGQAIFIYTACISIGINKHIYKKIFPFTLICQTIIETPTIFCLLVAFITIYINIPVAYINHYPIIAIFLTSTSCLFMGSLGAAISSSKIAVNSCLQIMENELAFRKIFRANLLAIAFIESVLIYALIVSLILITKIPTFTVCLE